jgi:hypothetical protein
MLALEVADYNSFGGQKELRGDSLRFTTNIFTTSRIALDGKAERSSRQKIWSWFNAFAWSCFCQKTYEDEDDEDAEKTTVGSFHRATAAI